MEGVMGRARARGGFKPNGIKFIMFLKMSMFYIRGIIILARQRNNLRDTIMKSRDYTRRKGRVVGAAGGPTEEGGCRVSVSEYIYIHKYKYTYIHIHIHRYIYSVYTRIRRR